MALKHIKKLQSKKITFVLLCFCAFVFFIFFTISARAQVTSGGIAVSISPESPGSFENVTVTLSSFLVDLERAQIIWLIGGKAKLSGIGKRVFSFQTLDIGSTTIIDILITTTIGNQVTKQITIVPNEIDLLWEAVDSYVPPFYKGKALPSSEGRLKIVALPTIKRGGAKINPKSLVYNWERNSKRFPDSSGYGKNSFSFKNSYLNTNETITVRASSLDNRSQATSRVFIAFHLPKIIFYEDHPLEGINYNLALNQGFRMRGKRATIVAEPYFFSPKFIRSPDLRYQWTINNKPISTPEKKNVLFLRLGEEEVGIATISLAIDSISRLFQSAQAGMDITLGP